jgi:hypothetical protein
LESTLETIVEAEPVCKIVSVKMAGEFQNVYLNKVDADGSGDDDDDDDDDDEKPRGKKGKKGKKTGKKPDADEDGDDDEDAAEIEEGDIVMFKPPRAKKAKRCVVDKVKGEKVTLHDEDDEDTIYKGILLELVEAVDPDEDDDDDDDDDDEKPRGKKGKKGKKTGKKPDADEDGDDDGDGDDDDGEEVEIEKGSKVAVNYKGKEYTGKVKDLDEDDETITVRFKVGKDFVTKTFSQDKVEAA